VVESKHARYEAIQHMVASTPSKGCKSWKSPRRKLVMSSTFHDASAIDCVDR